MKEWRNEGMKEWRNEVEIELKEICHGYINYFSKNYQSRLPITISVNKIRTEIISADDSNAFVRKYAKISIQTRRD